MSRECLQPQTIGNSSINTGYYSAINIVLCSPAYVTHAVADFKNCATVDIYTLGEYIAAMENHDESINLRIRPAFQDWNSAKLHLQISAM
jgi:hypothetical protein